MSIIALSTYLPSYHLFLKSILFFVIIAILAAEFLGSTETKQRFVLFSLLVVTYYSNTNPILFSFLSTCYYSYILNNQTKSEINLWLISSTLPVLIFTIEILLPIGIPFGIFLIWWWGFGYLIIVTICLLTLRHKTFLVVSVFCIISFIGNEYSRFQDHSKIVFLKSEFSNTKFTEKNIQTISQNSDLIEKIDKDLPINKATYVIPLIRHPSLNENFIKRLNTDSTFVLFAEHDNLGAFINSKSRFKSDSYQRKAPWIVYKPIFRTDLMLSSNKDSLYCSNIGCTIKWNLNAYPIVWDYNSIGTPILLAVGQTIRKKKIIFFGDSDPIVPFLSSYNPEFLRRLFGETDIRLMLQIVPVIVASLLMLYSRISFGLVLQIGLVTLSIVANYLPNYSTITSDINIKTNLKIQSPHYDFNYSSLPKLLTKEGYSVTINQKVKSKIEVHIFQGFNMIKKLNSLPTVIFMYPGSTVILNGQKIRSGDLPLGNVQTKIDNKPVVVEDARTIYVNRGETPNTVYKNDNFYFVATGNPQKNIKLISAVFENSILK